MRNRGFCSQEDAFELLKPFFALLWEGWRQALGFAQSAAAIFPFPGRRNPTTRAMLMNDFMCGFVEKHLGSMKGVSVIRSEGVTMLDFEGKLVMRFKKLDDSRQASNIETTHQLLLFSQGVQYLEGMPSKATIVINGYQLDPVGGLVEDVLVTCPREFEGGNHWDFSVPRDAGEGGAHGVIAPAPIPMIPPPKVRARGKKIDKE
jgi:hypothetical protein